LTDLEAGTRELGVEDLPDIPEASGANSASWGEETKGSVDEARKIVVGGSGAGARRATSGERSPSARIDPRTGIVSPQAVSRDSARERGELPIAAVMGAPRRAVTEQARRP
jgi:hypothetical protein